MTPVHARYVEAFGKKADRSAKRGRFVAHFFSAGATSYVVSEGLNARFELVWSIKGKVNPALGEAVLGYFEQLGAQKLSAGATLAHAAPGFEGMTHTFVAADPFSIRLDGEWLSTLEKLKPSRELFAVRPVFDGEAAALQKNVKKLADTLVQIRWEDPKRKPFAGPAPSRKPAPSRAKSVVGAKLDALLAKLRKKQPVVFDSLMERRGADAKTLEALAKKLKAPLHADLRTLLGRFDGTVPLFEYTTLSVSEIASWAKAPKKPGVPFAADGGGNLFCIDEAGVVRQWEIRGRAEFERAPSLEKLLTAAIKEA
jgi:hypothetical protein